MSVAIHDVFEGCLDRIGYVCRRWWDHLIDPVIKFCDRLACAQLAVHQGAAMTTVATVATTRLDEVVHGHHGARLHDGCLVRGFRWLLSRSDSARLSSVVGTAVLGTHDSAC